MDEDTERERADFYDGLIARIRSNSLTRHDEKFLGFSANYGRGPVKFRTLMQGKSGMWVVQVTNSYGTYVVDGGQYSKCAGIAASMKRYNPGLIVRVIKSEV